MSPNSLFEVIRQYCASLRVVAGIVLFKYGGNRPLQSSPSYATLARQTKSVEFTVSRMTPPLTFRTCIEIVVSTTSALASGCCTADSG